MNRNHNEKTIEGDLFKAFVEAGAISKANADDPKKSSLVRCARTDKGVHAAGNLISLKLIIEDQEILKKINQYLSPQIRVFGIKRTTGSFSAYQLCDSRIYEYLIPTHAFVPPHPKCFLGKKLVELAEEVKDTDAFLKRQIEVSSFWKDAEDHYIKPILDKLDPSTRLLVLKAFYELDIETPRYEVLAQSVKPEESANKESLAPKIENLEPGHDVVIAVKSDSLKQEESIGHQSMLPKEEIENSVDQVPDKENDFSLAISKADGSIVEHQSPMQNETHVVDETLNTESIIQAQFVIEPVVKQLKVAYNTARNAYRIHPERLARVRSVLSRFVGPQNFHNYTVYKAFADASAKRVIKTFVVHKDPIIINGTEWLSLKVHGQSFMMHQIRKMVSMAALIVRCGCHEERLRDSYGRDKISIPKAPGLGLLLERPVFDTYNERFAGQHEILDFGRYETEMDEFKQREIYERIFREEERDNQSAPPFFLPLLDLPRPNLIMCRLTSCRKDSTLSSTPSTTSRPRSSSTFPRPALAPLSGACPRPTPQLVSRM